MAAAAKKLVGRVSAVYTSAVLVDVLGQQAKFPMWLTRLRAALPAQGLTTTLSDNVAIEQRGDSAWEVVETGLPAISGMPPLPVHPVNTSLSRTKDGQKEVNNVGRYYATKWEASKMARDRVNRDRPQK